MKNLIIIAFITLGFTSFAQNDAKAETLLKLFYYENHQQK